MSMLRSAIFGAVALVGASVAVSQPAQADANVDFYIGSNGARNYNDYDNRYYGHQYRPRYNNYDDRYYGRTQYRPHYVDRPCQNRVSNTWRYGERYRVVDRVCYDRRGRSYIADRDFYPLRRHHRHNGW